MEYKIISAIALYAGMALAGGFELVKAPVIQLTEAIEPKSTTQEVQEATPNRSAIQGMVELRKELAPICGCESAGSKLKKPVHYEPDGKTLLIGRVNPADRGMCQINTEPRNGHLKTAAGMGLDIMNRKEDYILFANWLYETRGSSPWNWSRSCWK